MNIANQGFPATRADLNNALQALVSNSSGTSAPSTTFANQWWYDTTNNKMYLRNEANNAWIEVFTLDQTNNEWQLTTGVVQAKDSDGLALKTDDGNTRLFINDSDGNVGIGTTDVNGGRLVIGDAVSGDTSLIQLLRTGVTERTNFIGLSDSDALVISADENNEGADSDIRFKVDGSERLKIDSTGDIILGGTSTADETNKSFNFQMRSHDTDEENFNVMQLEAEATFNQITIGGGTSALNCATAIRFLTGNIDTTTGTERMRVDNLGNVNIGSTTNVGYGPLQVGSTSTASTVMQFVSSTTGYGTIHFGDATSGADRYVGYIQYNHNGNRLSLNASSTVGLVIAGSDRMILDDDEFYPIPDNHLTLGWSGGRFVQIYAVSGSINTSDRNEKQDIEDLSEAEKRVAIAAKGLIKKYRWIDAVEQKGDDARIHVGIIAQDLKSAFEAEGLDPHRYGMFCSDTWWTKDRVVPAVEAVEAQNAVYDEQGNIVSEAVEAVEAQDAHTVTDTFRTADEAPEGATEHTRLGVRYDELFAFIIGSM